MDGDDFGQKYVVGKPSFYDVKPDGGGGGGVGKKMLRHPSPRATHAQMMTKVRSEAERGEEVSLIPIVK